jgi:hypothetical protein
VVVRVEVKVGEEVKVKGVDVEREGKGPVVEGHAWMQPKSLQALGPCYASMEVG